MTTRARILAALLHGTIWGVILGAMVLMRGLVRRSDIVDVAHGPGRWELAGLPLGVFAVVFLLVFGLTLAGVNLRLDAVWLRKNARRMWIAWGLLMLTLVILYVAAHNAA